MSIESTTETSSIRAGSTYSWAKTLSDYSAADGYSAVYEVRGPGSITLTGTGSAATYTFTASATTTNSWTPGHYWWVLYAIHAGSGLRYEVEAGEWDVVANFAALQNGYDGRTHVKRVLDAIEAVLERRATKDQLSMAINGRSLARMPIEQLLLLRNSYKREYTAEQEAKGLADGDASSRIIRVRFQSEG